MTTILYSYCLHASMAVLYDQRFVVDDRIYFHQMDSAVCFKVLTSDPHHVLSIIIRFTCAHRLQSIFLSFLAAFCFPCYIVGKVYEFLWFLLEIENMECTLKRLVGWLLSFRSQPRRPFSLDIGDWLIKAQSSTNHRASYCVKRFNLKKKKIQRSDC